MTIVSKLKMLAGMKLSKKEFNIKFERRFNNFRTRMCKMINKELNELEGK